MKKNGFTLVELIAVVVIISIIGMLATPNIMNLMKRGKEGSFVSEVEDLVSNATYMYKNNNIRNNMEPEADGTYRIYMKDINGNVPTYDPYGYEYKLEENYVYFQEDCTTNANLCTRLTGVYIKSCKKDTTECHCIVKTPIQEFNVEKEDIKEC